MSAPKEVLEARRALLAQADEVLHVALGRRAAIDPNWRNQESLLLQDALQRQKPKHK